MQYDISMIRGAMFPLVYIIDSFKLLMDVNLHLKNCAQLYKEDHKVVKLIYMWSPRSPPHIEKHAD